MAVCQYFLRGQCRFGDSCRNEHPANPRQSGFGNQSWTNTNAQPKPALLFTQDSMKCDLSSDKPLWPLSSYGPAKNEPNLLSGLDESMEELRVRAVLALKAGNSAEYAAYESSKIQAAEQAYTNARNNLSSAYQTAANQTTHGGTKQPTASSSSSSSPFTSTSAFGSSAPSTTSAFGSTSAFGQGQSAFGQPSQSAFGQPSTSAFGAGPSSAQSTTGGSTFGQSSFGQPQQGQQSAFGSVIKPASGAFSAFANAASSSPFAAAAQAVNQNQNQSAGAGSSGSGGSGGGGGFSAFSGGQPSAFGSGASNTNASGGGGGAFGSGGVFGAPAPVFGQPSQPSQPQTSAFGSLQTQPTSVFGQPSAFGNNNNNTGQTQSAFGAPQSSTTQPQSAFAATRCSICFWWGREYVRRTNPLNAQPTTSSVFTPLSNPSNPLNASSQQPQSAFGGGSNPLGSAQPAQPFNAFTSTSSPFGNTTTTTTTTAPSPFSAQCRPILPLLLLPLLLPPTNTTEIKPPNEPQHQTRLFAPPQTDKAYTEYDAV
ncbi:hypothetical protein NP233_g1601 [Leucocoprinus birnbaumii]|uniref:C3H1-type domain-containing protein n=1 Tax=Leucocoprinus birnbaumii TaxID=56174 RepID=A0AAD5W2A4_9AGAR|nr:hypothetical protein NP233_g1601 [Leucocoprinus birnbaumii]